MSKSSYKCVCGHKEYEHKVCDWITGPTPFGSAYCDGFISGDEGCDCTVYRPVPTMSEPKLNWTGESYLTEWFEGDDRYAIDVYPEGNVVLVKSVAGQRTNGVEIANWREGKNENTNS